MNFFMTALARPAVYAGVLFALTTDLITNGIEFAIGWIAPDKIKRTTHEMADTWTIKIAKTALAVVTLSLVDIYVFDKAQPKSEAEEE